MKRTGAYGGLTLRALTKGFKSEVLAVNKTPLPLNSALYEAFGRCKA
ncbi:hypothetical protein MTBBW1_1710001 [Desulfamplus magnetovallimortis]|uniref:Uncharacterized protein n=1 Tax=Desulfamplus magnetovallimortis TaxID=1246637 RepID=A0A1W1H9L7_9BACT|nr:hypothetical protein MTBBW1_1710001 [Desulfamplus magnetovallimortis]